MILKLNGLKLSVKLQVHKYLQMEKDISINILLLKCL